MPCLRRQAGVEVLDAPALLSEPVSPQSKVEADIYGRHGHRKTLAQRWRPTETEGLNRPREVGILEQHRKRAAEGPKNSVLRNLGTRRIMWNHHTSRETRGWEATGGDWRSEDWEGAEKLES